MARYRVYLVGRKIFEASTNKNNVGVAGIKICEQEKKDREHRIGIYAFQDASVGVNGDVKRRARTEFLKDLDSQRTDYRAFSNEFLRVGNWKSN